MFLPRLSPSTFLASSLVVAAVLASIQLTQAKSIRSLGYSNLRTGDAIKIRRGGCAAFGHSCFGGHGKRSESAFEPVDGEEGPGGAQPPADDFRSFAGNDGPRPPVEIFSRDQPDNEFGLIPPAQYREPEEFARFSPLFRKWLINTYRRGDLVSSAKN